MLQFFRHSLFKGIAILSIFFFLRIFLIQTFPLFNDESIHIRWGQIMIQTPSLAWASMEYIGKQPPLLWSFGVFAKAFGHLEASRIPTLFFSFPSIIIVYFWIKRLASPKAALWGMGMVATLPFFILFQSTALMEGVLFTVTVGVLSVLTSYYYKDKWYHPFLLGFLLSIGIWVKTNMIFLVGLTILTLLCLWIQKRKSSATTLITLVIMLGILSITIVPLLLHPSFSSLMTILPVYSYTFQEITTFPVSLWGRNLYTTLLGFSFYLSPLFPLFVIVGTIYASKKLRFTLFSMFLMLFLPIVIVGKIFTMRYIFYTIAPLMPLASIGLVKIVHHKTLSHPLISFCIGFLLLSYGLFFISSPRTFYSRIPPYLHIATERDYAIGPTAGYGLKEVVDYISATQNPYDYTVIAIADTPGNPSDYILAYYYFHSKIKVVFATTTNLADFSKLTQTTGAYPVTLIARNSHIHEDIRPFLSEKKRILLGVSPDYLGIYSVNLAKE